MYRVGWPSPPGRGLRPCACRALFVCNGRPSVTNGIWSDDGCGSALLVVEGTAHNQRRRSIHQSSDDRREYSGAASRVRTTGSLEAKVPLARQLLIGQCRICYSRDDNRFRLIVGVRWTRLYRMKAVSEYRGPYKRWRWAYMQYTNTNTTLPYRSR